MALLSRSSIFALTMLLLVLSLSGCHSTVPTPVSPAADSDRTAPPSPDLNLAAVRHVQSLPLYQQAQSACNRHQYRQAANQLDHLAASSNLTDLELAFCHQQRDLCLSHTDQLASRKDAKTQSGDGVTSSPPHPLTLSPSAPSDCGPRALLLICQQLGIKAKLESLRQKADITEQGASLQGLAQAAQSVGLKAEGVQVSREALAEAQMPALAWVNGNHFVAVLALHGSGESGTAIIHDPNQPDEERISQEKLLRLCSGYLLLVQR